MTFPAPDEWRPPPAPQHAAPCDIPSPLHLQLRRALRLAAVVGACTAGLCLIIMMVALVAVTAGPRRTTHLTAASRQHPAQLSASEPGPHGSTAPAVGPPAAETQRNTGPAGQPGRRATASQPTASPSAGKSAQPGTGQPSVLASFTGTGNQARLPFSVAPSSQWELDWHYRCQRSPAGQLVIAEGDTAIAGALVDALGNSGYGSAWAGPATGPHYLVVISSCSWAIQVLGSRP